jgi:hypothetical protein
MRCCIACCAIVAPHLWFLSFEIISIIGEHPAACNPFASSHSPTETPIPTSGSGSKLAIPQEPEHMENLVNPTINLQKFGDGLCQCMVILRMAYVLPHASTLFTIFHHFSPIEMSRLRRDEDPIWLVVDSGTRFPLPLSLQRSQAPAVLAPVALQYPHHATLGAIPRSRRSGILLDGILGNSGAVSMN